MAKFLHIADIHLGFDRYNSPERTKDFFRALKDVFERFAVGEAVDFVLLAGDLFEHRNIQPAILNQAQICLQILQNANIPVLAIEGNHDNRPYGTRTSWLKYLSEWGLLMLLEPNDPKSDTFLSPWNEQSRSGGYIDLACGIRVIGSNWYGATAPRAIEQFAAAIQALPSGPDHTVMLFHHGLEGQISRYAGALRYSDLLPLRAAGIDYLALGHIHKHYTVDDWVFNPGALEANTVEEAQYQRGALLVEVSDRGWQANLRTDYRQRPIHRLSLTVHKDDTQDQVIQKARDLIHHQAEEQWATAPLAPIVELRMTGQVGFDRLELDIRELQQQLQMASGALVFLLKYDVEEVAYETPISMGQSRGEIERNIFADLLSGHRDYKKRANALAHGLTDLKERQLSGDDEPALYEFVEALLQVATPDQKPTTLLPDHPDPAEGHKGKD
jgi:exonuclease SbcD